MSTTLTTIEADRSLVRVTHIVYALHALGLAIGAFGAATVLGSFLFGWPSIIAVVINYVKRGEARGTWLESHFRWQIRTFWFALLWGAIGGLLAIVLIGWVILFADMVWIIYRIAKGWLDLNDRKSMPL